MIYHAGLSAVVKDIFIGLMLLMKCTEARGVIEVNTI